MVHPLEDSSVTNFFYYIWRRRNNLPQHEVPGLDVRIPHTIAYEHNFPKGWYYHTGKKGIMRKTGKEIESKAVHHTLVGEMSEETPNEGLISSAPKSKDPQDADIVAIYIERRDQDQFAIEYLDKEKLSIFEKQLQSPGGSGINISNKNGLLQQYIPPAGSHEEVIQVVWSPYTCYVEKRRNITNLFDPTVEANRRGMTFQAPCALTGESRVAPKLIGELQRIVETIADHFEMIEKRCIEHTVMYFKTDSLSRLWLLWCPIIRFRAGFETRDRKMVTLPRFQMNRVLNEKTVLSEEEKRVMLSPPLKVKLESLIQPPGPAIGLPYQSRLKPKLDWLKCVEAKIQTGSQKQKCIKLQPLESKDSTLYAPASSARYVPGMYGSFTTKAQRKTGFNKKSQSMNKIEVLCVEFTMEEYKQDPKMDVNAALMNCISGPPDARITRNAEMYSFHQQIVHAIIEVTKWLDNLVYLLYSQFLHDHSESVAFSLPTEFGRYVTTQAVTLLHRCGCEDLDPQDEDNYCWLNEREFSMSIVDGTARGFVAPKASVCSMLRTHLIHFKLVTLRNLYSKLVYEMLKEVTGLNEDNTIVEEPDDDDTDRLKLSRSVVLELTSIDMARCSRRSSRQSEINSSRKMSPLLK